MDKLADYNFLELIGHISYTMIFFSFLVRKILWLRVLAIVASCFSIFYNYSIVAEPLWIPIQWNIIFILTNIFQIGLLLKERRDFKLEGHEAYLKDNFFPELTAGEFKLLTKNAYLRTSNENEILIRENSQVETLMVLIHGKVSVTSCGREVARLGKGKFLGEMSFLTGERTKGQVQAIGEVVYFFWDREVLKSQIIKKPRLMNAIQRVLSQQLIDYILDDEQKGQVNFAA